MNTSSKVVRWRRLAIGCLLIVMSFGSISTRARAQRSGTLITSTIQHEFVYKSPVRLSSVTVAGTFNDWNRNAAPLVSDSAGRIWRTTLQLPMGKHFYKFVVNGHTFVTDPASDRSKRDKMGNSELFLAPPDYARPASPFDGITAQSAILHPTSVPYLNYDRGLLTLSLRARPNDLAHVTLKVGSRRYPMSVVSVDDLYAVYAVQINWKRQSNLPYTFELADGSKTLELGANGLSAIGPTSSSHVTPFLLDAAQYKPFVVPDWVERSVFYQIFPDRFANGDKTNDPPDVVPWKSAPTGGNRFGGDVQGVREHVPYLTELGISAIYFTPVFKSPSNHRYDVENYKAINPQFGSNAQFAALTRDLRARGIRTVMDFVFNHSASTFLPFVDVCRNGAASPYMDWYFIHSYPVHAQYPPNYEAYGDWWGMPRLNEANPATRDYMLDVVSYWKNEVSLAGLRLDVADKLDMGFLRALRQRTKELDPQMWILGETWNSASPWLQGDQWDAAMNYPFLFANVNFFAEGKTSPSQFAAQLMELYRSYAPQVSRSMMNSLSTHDTPRFLTRCHGNQDLHRLAAAVQFTWPGAPCIYYGEELGMPGGNDPDNRRGMDWDLATADNSMLRYYKRLTHLRRTNRALQSGTPSILLTDDPAQALAYARILGKEMAIVAVNRSGKERTLTITLPESNAAQAIFVDALSGCRVFPGEHHTLKVTLPPVRAAILLPAAKPGRQRRSIIYGRPTARC